MYIGATQAAGNLGQQAYNNMFGGGGVDPLTIGGLAASTLGGLLGGGPDNPPATYTGVGSLPQVNLLNRMIQRAGQGGGEFGLGPTMRSAYGTLQGQAAGRGIPMDSGVMQSRLAEALSGAMAADTNNRRNYMMGLAQARPWTMNYQKLDHTLAGSNARDFGIHGGGQKPFEPARSSFTPFGGRPTVNYSAPQYRGF